MEIKEYLIQGVYSALIMFFWLICVIISLCVFELMDVLGYDRNICIITLVALMIFFSFIFGVLDKKITEIVFGGDVNGKNLV